MKELVAELVRVQFLRRILKSHDFSYPKIHSRNVAESHRGGELFVAELVRGLFSRRPKKSHDFRYGNRLSTDVTTQESLSVCLLVWICELDHEAGPYHPAVSEHATLADEILNAALTFAGTHATEIQKIVAQLRVDFVQPLRNIATADRTADDPEIISEGIPKSFPVRVIERVATIAMALSITASPSLPPEVLKQHHLQNSLAFRNAEWCLSGAKLSEVVADPAVFVPSNDLVNMIYGATHRESGDLRSQDFTYVATRITRATEGLLQTLASMVADQTNEATSQFCPSTAKAQFDERICRDLSATFGLTTHAAPGALDALHREMLVYATSPRLRLWGTLTRLEDALILQIDCQRVRSDVVDFAMIPNDCWVSS